MNIDRIFYINLDHRTDRRELIEKELNQFGLEYERFSAIYDPLGAVGCSKSHLEVFKIAKERGYKRILIMEDDFTFIVSREIFEDAIQKITSQDFDVCMLAYNTNSSENVQESFWRKVNHSFSTSCYIMNSTYFDKVIPLIEESIPLLKQTNDKPLYAIDSVFTKIQSKDKWYESAIRIGIQRPSYSDIELRHVNYGV